MKKRKIAIWFMAVCLAVTVMAAGVISAGAVSPGKWDVGNYNDYSYDGGGNDYSYNDSDSYSYDDDDDNTEELDVGNFNNYSGGGSGGSHSYSGGSSSRSSRSSSSGSSSGSIGFLGAIPVIAIIVIFAILWSIAKKKVVSGTAFNPASQTTVKPQNHQTEILNAINAIDPAFSDIKFIAWSKEVFITLQQAWTARDWSIIRPFEKEELFRQHELQLQEYINLKRINIIERINVSDAYLHLYKRDNQFEYLTVYMSTRMVDYIIDENTRQVIKGDPNKDCYMNYLLTFMRKKGVKTKESEDVQVSKTCPNCGAPLTITSGGKCEYCDSIITSGEFDWVLSDMDAVRPGLNINNSGVVITEDVPNNNQNNNPFNNPNNNGNNPFNNPNNNGQK